MVRIWGGLHGNTGSSLSVFALWVFASVGALGVFHPQASLAQTRCFDPPGKTHQWRAEGTAADSVGLDDGTLVGDTTYGPGRVGQAFQFDGAGDYVQMLDASTGAFSSGDFSLLFWMNADTLAPGSYLLGKSLPDFGQGWDIRLHNQQVQVSGVNGWAANITTSDFAVTGTWYHVALVGTASAVRLYVDGALAGTTGRAVGTTSAPFRIGLTTNFGGNAFAGRIDEVTIFDRALSPFEIASVIAEATGGACPGSTTTTSTTTTTTLPRQCGDETGDGNVTATDALAVLRCSVGSRVCMACVADASGDGNVTATDALMVLRRAVGQTVVLACPAC